MIELEAVAIDEADGGMGPEQRDGEHLQQVTTDLHGGIDLGFTFSRRHGETFFVLLAGGFSRHGFRPIVRPGSLRWGLPSVRSLRRAFSGFTDDRPGGICRLDTWGRLGFES